MSEPQPTECEFCGYETPALDEYPMHRYLPNRERKKWLCEICASTRAGSACEYPEQYENSIESLRMIAYVGNLLRDEIRKLKP